MSDSSRLADGSVGQFAAIGGGVVLLCIIGSILTAFGMSGPLLAGFFILSALVLSAILSTKTAAVMPSTASITLGIEALSAFGLFGIVGAVFAFGHDGLVVGVGLAAGFVLSLLFVGPRYSTIATRSLPDFLSLRYGGGAIRYLALCVMVVVTVLFVAAQLVAAGLIASQALGIVPLGGIIIAAIAIVILALPLESGGMSKGHVALAVVALVGTLIAAVWFVSSKTGILIPHFAYGGLFTDIDAAENRLGLETHFSQPGEGLGLFAGLSLTMCLAVGAAVMPHLLARSALQGSQAKSQQVLRNGLIIFVVLITALPALGVLARVEVLALFTAVQNAVPFSDGLPVELLQGAQACGATPEMMQEACTSLGYEEGLPVEELRVDPQAVLLALPALTGISGWVRALIALVGFSVVAIAGAGAARTLGSALSSRTPSMDAFRVQNIGVFGVIAVGGILAASSGLSLISLGAWAYSLIGAALVGPVIIGLSWRRTNASGALAGLAGGFGVTVSYILGSHWGFDLISDSGDEWLWLGLPSMMAGIFGIIASVALTVIFSLMGPKPKPSQIAFVGAPIRPVKEDPAALE